MYKSIVLGYTPKAKDVGKAVEEEANKQEKEGFKLVSFAISPSAKPVLIFSKEEEKGAHQNKETKKPGSKPSSKPSLKASASASASKPASEVK